LKLGGITHYLNLSNYWAVAKSGLYFLKTFIGKYFGGIQGA